uniref:SERPIN domain-containing protein n=1 Tax=Rhabditophanes sp. KR3021 TaxID=114890 RepID=A0AC35U9N2_9BILA
MLIDNNTAISSSHINSSVNFLKIINNTSPNVAFAFSPISLTLTFAMVFNGAKNETKEEIKNLLFKSVDDEAVNSYFKQFLDTLNEKSASNILVADKIYLRNGVEVLELFKKTMVNFYNGQFEEVDFQDTAKASSIINSFVEDATKSLIKNLLKPHDIKPNTQMILINALYFKGKWMNVFDAKVTQKRDFFTSAGAIKQVDMMYNHVNYEYTEDSDYQLIKLPYQNSEISMVILLPVIKNNFELLLQNFDDSHFKSLLSNTRSKKVKLYLPKFKIESLFNLNSMLKQLGIVKAFGSDADFSGLVTNGNLFIDKVVQKIFVEVNEEGTEAAAASAILMSKRKRPMPIREIIFRADHPFMFYIIQDSKYVLFNGIYK